MTPLCETPLALAVVESGFTFMMPVLEFHSATGFVTTEEESGCG